MKKMVSCGIAIVITACCLASAQDVDFEVESSLLIKGKALKQVFDGKSAASHPSWSPMKEKCPLSPSKATQLVIGKLGKAATHLKLCAINLERVPGMQDKWYYIVNLLEDPESMEGDYANVIVCLNGKVPKFQKEE